MRGESTKRPMNVLVIMLLLGSGFFVLASPSIPKAHATGPLVNNTCNNHVSSSTTALTCVLGTNAAGDIGVFLIELWGASTCPSNISNGFPSTSQTETMTQNFNSGCVNQSTNNYYQIYIYTFTTKATATDTINLQVASGNFMTAVEGFDVTGTTLNILGPVQGSHTWTGATCAASCTMTTNSSVDFGAPALLIAAIDLGAPFQTATGPACNSAFPLPGSSFTFYPSTGNSCGASEYGYSGSVTAPTSYSWTWNHVCCSLQNGITYEVGIGIGAISPTVISVVPCNWYQQQCWWYPTLMISLVASFFVAVGLASEASPRGLTFLALTGMTYGSFLAVIVGIISFFIPIILLIGLLFYAVRFKPN